MKTKRLLLSVLALMWLNATLLADDSMNILITKALKNAERQCLEMARVCSETDSILPKTFEKGKLVTSDSRWWCSGFFPGILWYLYENNATPQMLRYAKQFTARVEREKYTTNNHDVGFMLYCSFGNGLRVAGNASYNEVLETGARSLATRYSEQLGVIKSWDSNKAVWQYPVIIDNMMNLELLFWAANYCEDERLRTICLSHADKTMQHHYRPDASCYHVVSYDTLTAQPHKKQTHQGYADESAWARGQAWGLYGFTVMYRATKDPKYLAFAKRIADFLIEHPNLPEDKIPYWDFNAPSIPNAPRDASAGAIMASALIELSDYVDESLSEEYLEVAEEQIEALASSAYTAAVGTNGNFILKHSVGSMPHNVEVDVPLTYADYYFVEAMMRWKQRFGKCMDDD